MAGQGRARCGSQYERRVAAVRRHCTEIALQAARARTDRLTPERSVALVSRAAAASSSSRSAGSVLRATVRSFSHYELRNGELRRRGHRSRERASQTEACLSGRPARRRRHALRGRAYDGRTRSSGLIAASQPAAACGLVYGAPPSAAVGLPHRLGRARRRGRARALAGDRSGGRRQSPDSRSCGRSSSAQQAASRSRRRSTRIAGAVSLRKSRSVRATSSGSRSVT